MLDKTTSVLIIEDENELSDLLKGALEKTGLKALCALDIPRASKMLANQKFDCIVTDQLLGTKTGDTLIQQVRKNPLHLNHVTPILLISAALDVELLKSLSGLISGAMVKPFEFTEFTKKVRGLCGLSD